MLTLAATAMPTGAAPVPGADPGVGVLAASAGCGKSPTLTSGTHTIQSGGQNRSFILRLPSGYDSNRQYRLIFGFHWLGGNANNVASGDYYGLGSLSANSAIFVAPEGLNNGWANSGGADVTFTDNMITRITNDLCVDTSQLFSLGFSYGGGMSYALACARANVFRAVAIYAGGVISGCSGGTQPIAYMQAHGLSDNVLSISGGRSMRDRFVGNNGCTPANPPEPTQGSGRHTSFTYSGCRAGYPVVWHAFDGGHIFDPRDAGSSTSWLPGETWRFFSQFSSTTTTPPTTSSPPVTTSPPPVTTSPPPAGSGCTATYAVTGQWGGGFQAEVRVTAGSSAIRGWTVTWTYANGQRVTQSWNATVTTSGSTVTARNVDYNGTLAAGATATFGFLGSWTGSNPVPAATCTAT
ncbi:cellulose binding domain-containing protein [Phytohabitans sp. LJ34]|uniref:cellulose binding domain-containing protein n=1 Tax=Phytohabitans sp. LJ34 TaxID=3452217 RepID=UPI003F8CD236